MHGRHSASFLALAGNLAVPESACQGLFVVAGQCGVALVGSHNLTRHGLAVNIEAGVLFKALSPILN